MTTSNERMPLWPLLLMTVSALLLGLSLVWLNIERMDLAYELRNMEKDLDQKSAHAVKLEVERDKLTSPYRLNRLAEQLGLVVAEPGQIRRLAQTGSIGTREHEPKE